MFGFGQPKQPGERRDGTAECRRCGYENYLQGALFFNYNTNSWEWSAPPPPCPNCGNKF